MSMLTPSAHLVVCPKCGRHFHFVFNNGYTDEMGSVEEGRAVLRIAQADGLIDRHEFDELSRQLGELGLDSGPKILGMIVIPIPQLAPDRSFLNN